MRKIFFVYLLSATITSAFTQDTLTVELISKYTYDIQHVDGKLSGPGWDSLVYITDSVRDFHFAKIEIRTAQQFLSERP